MQMERGQLCGQGAKHSRRARVNLADFYGGKAGERQGLCDWQA